MNKRNGGPWSVEEMTVLYDLKNIGKSYEEISVLLNRSSFARRTYNENLLQKKFSQTDWNYFHSQKQQLEEITESQNDLDIEKKKVIQNTLQNQERLVLREEARIDVIIDRVKTAIYQLPKPKMSDLYYKPPSTPRKYSSEHVGVIISDAHIGESYTLEDTGGISEFNLGIFKKRLRILRDSVLEIAERHRTMYELPVLHVFALGDMVAGMKDAGKWSPAYIDLSIYQQMFEGIDALRDVLSTWYTAFEKICFYGIYGNHGRIGKRGNEKVSDNWDRLVYNYVKISMSEYDRIEWMIPEAWFIQTEIQNHTFYLMHGDGIRGSMGIPYYGVEKAQSSISGIMNKIPDYTLMGHFHTPAELQTTGSKVIMNGSFMGGDMYSIRDLRRCDRAIQKIFGIHPKKGITWSYDLQLEPK